MKQWRSKKINNQKEEELCVGGQGVCVFLCVADVRILATVRYYE